MPMYEDNLLTRKYSHFKHHQGHLKDKVILKLFNMFVVLPQYETNSFYNIKDYCNFKQNISQIDQDSQGLVTA